MSNLARFFSLLLLYGKRWRTNNYYILNLAWSPGPMEYTARTRNRDHPTCLNLDLPGNLRQGIVVFLDHTFGYGSFPAIVDEARTDIIALNP